MSFDLKGYLCDAEGIPLNGLTVQLYNSTDLDTVLDSTTTDSNGMWEFTSLNTAITYVVKATSGSKVLRFDARSKVQFSAFEVPLAGCPSGLKYVMLNFIIDGQGVAITAGQKGHIQIPFGATIVSCSLLADQTGSIKVDIWKDTYANFPPTDADTITGANEPEIASGVKDTDSTLTSWTTDITADDILAFNVDSCTTITRCTVSLLLEKA